MASDRKAEASGFTNWRPRPNSPATAHFNYKIFFVKSLKNTSDQILTSKQLLIPHHEFQNLILNNCAE